MRPLSCCGKNPLGTWMNRYTFSAMVPSRISQRDERMAQHHGERPAVGVDDPVEDALVGAVEPAVLAVLPAAGARTSWAWP